MLISNIEGIGKRADEVHQFSKIENVITRVVGDASRRDA